jgi:hypothetical protein
MGADMPILAAAVGLPGSLERALVPQPSPAQDGGGTGGEPETARPPVDSPSNDDRKEDHSELAWRLRHLRRGVLQEATALVGDEDASTGQNDPAQGLARAGGDRAAASLLAGAALSGELNFLTTSSFDNPQQLFNGERSARNIAYMSVGAPAGSNADWAVRGALSQADLSAWVIAGTYSTRGPARHHYDAGLSYATQRYDGGNPAALREVTDGSRNAGAMYGFDTWTISPALSVNYGAQYARYDYLENQSLISPRVGATFSMGDRLRATAVASRRSVAPGAEEFLPPGDTGIWLPPQRTFSALGSTNPLVAERTNHLDVGVERDFGTASSVSLHAFRQYVADQLVTVFGLDLPGPPSSLGHYFVGTDGDVEARGLTAGFHTTTRRVQGSVEYSTARARWTGGADLAYWLLQVPSELPSRAQRIHDLSTTIRTDVPETATRVVIFYRVSSALAPRNTKDDTVDSRFDVQIRQSLPFLDFSTAKWEALVGIRNFFHESVAGQSMFDELLVVRPPTRVVGGLTMRF